MSRPSVEQVAEALRHEFGGFLAHDPHNPERFWTSTARAVLRVFEPETVTTAAELDALPVGSVVRTTGVPESFAPRVAEKSGANEWWVADEDEFSVEDDELDDLPATVLHRGDGRG